MLCKWHILAVWKVLSFLWLSVLKFHDDVTVGLFSSIDQLGWAIGGLFNLETHVFQFWEFLFNFFFTISFYFIVSLLSFWNPYYFRAATLIFSSFFLYLYWLTSLSPFLFFEQFLQISNYSAEFFILPSYF